MTYRIYIYLFILFWKFTDNRLKEKHVREHKAVLEYNEKYGIVDDGH